MVALSAPVDETSATRPDLNRSRVADASFEAVAAAVLGQMQQAFRAFLDAIPNGVKRAADVQRALDLDSKLAGQVYKVAHADNPAAACVNVPPRVSLDRMLKAAQRRVPEPLIAGVSKSYDGFEKLVESEGGNREELESMLGAFLPEERARQDLAARQSMFKGMSQIKGLAADAEVNAMLFNPSGDGVTMDRATLVGFTGLRRMRSDVKVRFGVGDHGKGRIPNPVTQLDGTPSEGLTGSFLEEFSTSPLPEFVARESPDGTMHYHVAGETVGMRSAVDLVMANKRAKTQNMWTRPGDKRKKCGAATRVMIPVRRATLDIFFRRDIGLFQSPSLEVYEAFQSLNEPLDENNRIQVQEEVHPILGGLRSARLPHVPRYVEMLEHVCEKVSWDPDSFAGYRLDLQFPIYGAQYAVWFALPVGEA